MQICSVIRVYEKDSGWIHAILFKKELVGEPLDELLVWVYDDTDQVYIRSNRSITLKEGAELWSEYNFGCSHFGSGYKCNKPYNNPAWKLGWSLKHKIYEGTGVNLSKFLKKMHDFTSL